MYCWMVICKIYFVIQFLPSYMLIYFYNKYVINANLMNNLKFDLILVTIKRYRITHHF